MHMRYLKYIIPFLIYCVSCNAQSFCFPYFERTDIPEFHIDKVEKLKDSTLLYCTFSAQAESWANISAYTYIEDVNTKQRYSISRSEGLPLSPNQRDFNTVEKISAILHFPSIGLSTNFNLIENPNKQSFNIYGINLNAPAYLKVYSDYEVLRYIEQEEFYRKSGNIDKALEFGIASLDGAKSLYGSLSSTVGNCLTIVANLFYQANNFQEAIKYAMEACTINKRHHGEKSPEYVIALGILSNCEFELSQFDQGLRHLEDIVALLDSIPQISKADKQNYVAKLNYFYLRLNINKRVKSVDSIVTEYSILYEANKDFTQGNTESAIFKLKDLLDFYEAHFQSADIDNYIFAVGSLSNMLVSVGNYIEADDILNKTIEFLKTKKIKPKQWRSIYEDKGFLYYAINNADMALYWYNLAKDLYDTCEENKIQYGTLLSNIAVCQVAKNNLSIAKQYSENAYNIIIPFYGDNNNNANDILLILNNLGVVYTKLKDFSKGKQIYKMVIDGAHSQQTIQARTTALINLAGIYLCEGNLQKIEELLIEAKNTTTISNIKDMAESDILFLQMLQKRDEAIKGVEYYNTRIKNELVNLYNHFSEAEREAYWTEKSQNMVFLNNMSALIYKTPQTINSAYDNVIFTKNMLINSSKLLGNIVKDCSKDIQNAYSSMVKMKNLLSDKHCEKDSFLIYREKINQLEKSIVSAIPDFGGKIMSQFKSHRDVQRMLSDNEIAIEYIYLPLIKTPLDKSELSYGALLLTQNDSIPKLIQLCSEKEFEEILNANSTMGEYSIDSLYASSDERLYRMIWEKLEPYIPQGSTVYYSPTGYINKINLSAISNGNIRLNEKYNFYEVSTTALINEAKQWNGSHNYNAALYGDINYYEDVNMMAEKAKSFSSCSSGDILATRSLNRGTWDLLPATKEEVDYIADIMKGKELNVFVYTQNEANEESFKNINSNAPELIHIATHGFYFSSERENATSFFNNIHGFTEKDYSMFYSGLLFAGCNNTWIGKEVPKEVEDGILTADEISRLDLSNNNLIVLSACDTGLGDIDRVDGVWGLQRGLKIAGAKKILMSLWKVPDKETKELMIAFYKELLSGNTPHKSLKIAQQEQIDAGKSPYYWAGFILLD